MDNSACDSFSAILGGQGNTVANAALGDFAQNSAIVSGEGNTVADYLSFIGGGLDNTITLAIENSTNNNSANVIGGGENNVIGGAITVGSHDDAIAGGIHNTITGRYGFIGAGATNQIKTTDFAVVDGGRNNTVTGDFGTVPGGYGNTAVAYSFAAGYQAQATYPGAFVWSDNASANELTTTRPFQFLVRASGGVTFYSNPAQTCGVTLSPGARAWTALPGCSAATRDVNGEQREIVELRGEIVRLSADEKALKAEVRSLVALRR